MDSRPKLALPRSLLEMVLQVMAVMGVLAAVGAAVSAWSRLPERVPTHFGFSGAPDGWGSKASLLPLPILAVVLYVGLTLLERVPHTYNYPVALTEENAARQYRIGRTMITCVKVTMVAIFAGLEVQMTRVALGETSGLGWWFVPVVAAGPLALVAGGLVAARRAR